MPLAFRARVDGCSIVNAPVGIGNVLGITVELPLPAVTRAPFRDLPLDPAELFAGDFVAVVFAILSSLKLA